MSVHPTTKNTLRGLLAAGTILLTSFGATGVAAASEPSSITAMDGNPSCATVGAGYTELKIEPVPQGRSSRSAFSISVAGRVFNWTSTTGVDVVIVKGGPNALVYRYTPEARSGTGLHAPVNDNGEYYGLSHISFCHDAGEDTAPPPPATCPDGQVMQNGKCVTPEPPKTCPSGQQMDNGGNCFTPQPPRTCPTGEQMNSDGECVAPPKPGCPEGQTMTASGECITPKQPGCPEGQFMNSAGECAEPKQQIDTPPLTVVVVENAPPVAATVANRQPAPAVGQVLGATGVVVAANARMQGPKRCVVRPFRQVLRGQGIKRVTMYVNGRKVQTMSGGRSSYSLLIDPRRYRTGVVRVSAKVEYVAASGRRAQTLSMTVLRCAKSAVQPRFAG